MALCDEIHEMPSRTIIEMLEAGFKFRRQPMLAMITNSGTDRKTICWEEHERAIRVAAGTKTPGADFAYVGDIIDKNADAQFSFVCALDPGDDPLKDPTCWAKANPLLGVTITEDYLADEVAKAVAMPGKLNATLRLNFCVWTDAETAWMTREALEPCLAEFDPADHHGKRTGIGIDLSQSRDITAKANIVQTGTIDVQVRVESEDGSVETKIVEKPTYDAWIEAWTPGDTINERSVRDDTPYDLWAREGHLNAPKGQSIRFDHVAQALADDDRNFEIGLVAYDRYAFRRFEDEVHSIGLDIPFVEHPQAGVKKGKPTQSMIDAAKARDVDPEGLWMPGSLLMLEECILERRIRLKINPVLISAMMSAVTDNDRYGNHWLAKERAVNKIDAVIALCMAIGAIAADPGESTGVAALLESLR
jgi:phage terminase large subunit-like protein